VKLSQAIAYLQSCYQQYGDITMAVVQGDADNAVVDFDHKLMAMSFQPHGSSKEAEWTKIVSVAPKDFRFPTNLELVRPGTH